MRLSICLAVLLLGAAPALAGPLEDGLAAYKAREFDKAVQLLKPLADKGNADAQEKIGRLYERLPPDQVGEAERAARSWQANRLKK